MPPISKYKKKHTPDRVAATGREVLRNPMKHKIMRENACTNTIKPLAFLALLEI